MTAFKTDYSNNELLDLELSSEQLAGVAAASGPSTGGKIILDLKRPMRDDGDYCRFTYADHGEKGLWGVFWCPEKKQI